MSKVIQDHLFELIKSLSRSEKRYFKLYISRHKATDKNNYGLLFDFLEKKETYNEQEVFKQFKKEAFLNNFSITKRRLYDQILSALDAFHTVNSVDAQLYKMMHGADILYKKSLYPHASRLLNSACKLAKKNERYSILSEIEDKQRQLLETRHYSSISKGELEEMQLKSNQLLEQVTLQSKLWFAKSYLFIDLNKKGQEQEQLKQHHSYINEITRNCELSVSNTYLFNHIEAAYYFAVNDYENSWKHLESNIILLENNTFLLEEFPNYYIGTLTNAIYVNEKLGNTAKADTLLKNLKEVTGLLRIGLSEDLLLKLFLNTSSIELSILTSRGEFEQALHSLPYIENGLKLYEAKIPQQRQLFYFFQFAGVHIALEEYAEALKWINRILNTPNMDSNEDIIAYTHILNLLVHLELKNNQLLPYTLKSTHRFLKTRNRLHSFEQLILQFISNFSNYREIDKQEAWEKLYSKLISLRDTKDYQSFSSYFDFETWAESKMTGRPFGKLKKMKNNPQKPLVD